MKRRFFLSAIAAAPVVASAPAIAAPMVEMTAADIAPVAQAMLPFWHDTFDYWRYGTATWYGESFPLGPDAAQRGINLATAS